MGSGAILGGPCNLCSASVWVGEVSRKLATLRVELCSMMLEGCGKLKFTEKVRGHLTLH